MANKHRKKCSTSLTVAVVVQSPGPVRLFVTPWTAAHQASLSLSISWSLPKFMFIASVMPSSYLILWCPLLLLPSIFSSIRDFSNESVCIRWPKYWSFSCSINPFNEYSGLISLKIVLICKFLIISGRHHWCNEHELGPAPGDGEGQGGLVCCSP